ncbi:MAG: TauD/TfdA family dioxygenase [Pseudomonadota bacterium]
MGLLEQGRLDEARQQATATVELVSPNWEYLGVLGKVLFELGLFFPAAHRVLIRAAQLGQITLEQLKMLAALSHRTWDRDLERQCLTTIAQIETVVGPLRLNPEQPNVLRLRSFEKSSYGIKTNKETGLRFCSLKRGHFSVKNLVDAERVNLFIGTVSGDNLLDITGLPPFEVFINCVSCADLDPVGLDRIEAFLKQNSQIPVINPPEKVRRTARAENYRRLNKIPDVQMPQTVLFKVVGAAKALATGIEDAGFHYPVIVRHQGTQTGISVEKIDDRPTLVKWLSEQPQGTDIYVISWVDCSWDDGFYHKTRVFFIDGVFYPVANLSSDAWQIHSGDRYRVMSTTPSTQTEEKRFLANPEQYLGSKAFKALHAIRDAIDLDFFGIDFTIDVDGNVVVFEANAAMRHNFDHAENFPYTRPHLERVSKAFADMVDRRVAERRAAVREALPQSVDRPDNPAVPIVKLAPFLKPTGALAAESRSRLVAQLIDRLSKPPYWLVLESGQAPIDLTWVTHVMQDMGAAGQPPGAEPQRISRTKVRVNSESAARTSGNVTRYSRTPDALPLHSDCSNFTDPPNLVAFAMERPDADGGGESLVLSAVDLVKELPEELIEVLRRPVFPFSPQKRFAVLEGEGDDLLVRYYRNQIASAAATQRLDDDLAEALDELDQRLAAAQGSVHFHMQAGDIIMLDNTRVMHGRKAMAPDSNRLMHRFRLMSPAIAARAL